VNKRHYLQSDKLIKFNSSSLYISTQQTTLMTVTFQKCDSCFKTTR